MSATRTPIELRPSFLAGLGEASREGLLSQGRRRRYPTRSILFFEADDPSSVFAICSGLVKLTINVDGHEVVLDVLGPGDLLGELSAIEGVTRSATAVAIKPVEAIAIPRAAFMSTVAADAEISGALLQMVARRLRGASRRQVEYGALDATGRVCRRLVEMAERFGTPWGDTIVISGPLTQSDIAAWAGLSREAVVKALHSLRAVGWVETSARSITVLDVDAVVARASLPS